MAKIGLRHVVAAALSVDNGDTATYEPGMLIGKAITANVSVEVSEVVLYADDSIAESIKEFKSGKISLNLDDLSYEVQGLLLGHTVTDETLIANSEDNAPYVGIGFYGPVMRNKQTKYRAVWFGKCQFGEPSDENKTKGEGSEFTTPTIEATIMPLANGEWKSETMTDTVAAALAWIDGKAGIVAGGGQ